MLRSTLLLSLIATTAAHAELVDRVAAVVNRDIIALSEVEERAAPELARVNQERDTRRRAELRAEVMKRSLDSLIGDKLLDSAIKELNIEVTEQDLDVAIEQTRAENNMTPEQLEQAIRAEGLTMAAYREFLRKRLGRYKLINLKVRGKAQISEQDLKAEYDRYTKREGGEAEVHARHILLQLPADATPEKVEEARKRALQLAEEAKKPGVDFAELAKQKSEGPSAKDGGDLGYFRRGVMMAEFDKAAFSMKVGEVSEPIRSRFGWHVFKVEDRREIPPKSFEEVKDQLKDQLIQSQLEKYTQEYVQELRQAALVEVKL